MLSKYIPVLNKKVNYSINTCYYDYYKTRATRYAAMTKQRAIENVELSALPVLYRRFNILAISITWFVSSHWTIAMGTLPAPDHPGPWSTLMNDFT